MAENVKIHGGVEIPVKLDVSGFQLTAEQVQRAHQTAMEKMEAQAARAEKQLSYAIRQRLQRDQREQTIFQADAAVYGQQEADLRRQMRETRQQRKRESLLRERPEPGALPAWATWGMRAFAGVASLRAIGDMGESVRGMGIGATLAGSGDAMLSAEGRLAKLEGARGIPVLGEVVKVVDQLTGASAKLKAELAAITQLEESRVVIARAGRQSLALAAAERQQTELSSNRDMRRIIAQQYRAPTVMGMRVNIPAADIGGPESERPILPSDNAATRAAKEAHNNRVRAARQQFEFAKAEYEAQRGMIGVSREAAELRMQRRSGEAALLEASRARGFALTTMDPSLRDEQARTNAAIDAAERAAYNRRVGAERTTLGFTGAAALADASMFGMGSSKLAGTLSKVGGWSAQLQTAEASILPQLRQSIQAQALAELTSYSMRGTRFAEILNPATTVIGDPFRIDPRMRDFEAGRTAAQTFASQLGATTAMAELPAVMNRLSLAIESLSKNSGLLAN